MKPKILFLTTVFPYPTNNGGKIKTSATIEALRKYFRIDMLCFLEDCKQVGDVTKLAPEDVDVYYTVHPITSSEHKWFATWRLIESLLKRKPYTVHKFYSSTLKHMFNNLISKEEYLFLYADHLAMAQYVNRETYEFVLDEHNYETGIIARRLKGSSGLRSWIWKRELRLLEKCERLFCQRASFIFAISPQDMDSIKKFGLTAPVSVLPPFINSQWPSYRPERQIHHKTILIIGSLFWQENYQAAKWFLDNVRAFLDTDIKIRIAGRGVLDKLANHIGDDAIELVDDFESLEEVVSDCGILAIPLQSGGGIRIKALQALKAGFPVVSTTVGVEGIHGVENGRNIIVVDRAEDFAMALNSVLGDSDSLKNISSQCASWSEKYYTEELFEKTLARCFTLNTVYQVKEGQR